MNMKKALVAAASLALLGAAGSVQADGQAVYKSLCFSCHDTGAAGAPKMGDKAAWAGRIGKGKDALYQAALNGKGAMPAKGGNPALSDADVKAAVDFMIANSK